MVTQFEVLEYLKEVKQATTNELMTKFNSQRNHIGFKVNQLERFGYVEINTVKKRKIIKVK